MARRVAAGAVLACLLGPAGCGGAQPAASVAPVPVPLPTMGLAGRRVALYPLTLIAASETEPWAVQLRPRETALERADSLIAQFLTQRAPEVDWVLPPELREAARRAPGLLADPDRMGTAILRARELTRVPDPLRSRLRNLTGVAADRLALVPASLSFLPTPAGLVRSELSIVLVDVRTGVVGWRTLASGEGGDPWLALWNALRTLVPDLP